MFTFNKKDFIKHCQLGTVCNGKGSIWSVKHAQNKTNFAAKIYNLDKCAEEFDRIQTEINLVRKLNQRNVISYLSVFTHEQTLWIIMPLYGYTSIARVVSAHFTNGLPEQALSFIFKDVLNALQYLHSRGIVHRAVRGSHILIDASGKCALSGLRHSENAISCGQWEKSLHSYPHEIESNLSWASPELLKQDLQGYNEKTDIYSVGISMCELGNGEVPYYQLEPQLMLVEKSYSREPFLRDINTYNMLQNGKDSGMGGSYTDCNAVTQKVAEKNFSAICHDFVATCLSFDPHNRPSAETLLQHSFIKKCRKISSTLSEILLPITPLKNDKDYDSSESDLLNKLDDIQLVEDEEVMWDL